MFPLHPAAALALVRTASVMHAPTSYRALRIVADESTRAIRCGLAGHKTPAVTPQQTTAAKRPGIPRKSPDDTNEPPEVARTMMIEAQPTSRGCSDTWRFVPRTSGGCSNTWCYPDEDLPRLFERLTLC